MMHRLLHWYWHSPHGGLVVVGEKEVEVEDCDCRIDAERVLGEWTPPTLWWRDGH